MTSISTTPLRIAPTPSTSTSSSRRRVWLTRHCGFTSSTAVETDCSTRGRSRTARPGSSEPWVFMCGPPGMMRSLDRGFRTARYSARPHPLGTVQRAMSASLTSSIVRARIREHRRLGVPARDPRLPVAGRRPCAGLAEPARRVVPGRERALAGRLRRVPRKERSGDPPARARRRRRPGRADERAGSREGPWRRSPPPRVSRLCSTSS